MPTNTANLNLFKYGSTDGARTFNIDEALNANWDKIDEAVAKKYTKAPTGIPELDLDSAVKAALGKARTALQSVTKADVGLSNVDNTSDANKPISTAQQAALNLKANIASPTFTGTPRSTTATAGTNTTQIATTAFVKTAVDNSATTINDSIAAVAQDITTHKADLAHVHWIGTATGTNTLTATYEAITALKNGLGVAFLNTTSSTLATTLNINGLGAIPILKADGNPVTNLKANGIYTLRYANGNFILQGEGGEYGTATASDVLKGKTFGTENGLVEGLATIASLGGKRWASGSDLVASIDKINFKPLGYNAEGREYFRVTGIPFNPSSVIIYNITEPSRAPTIYNKAGLMFQGAELSVVNVGSSYYTALNVDTNYGFLLPSMYSGSSKYRYSWIAYE